MPCVVCAVLLWKVLICLFLLPCVDVHMRPSVCLSQHHESVELASAETSEAGLRASSFWLDRSLCCSWETHQQREKRKENKPSSSFFYPCHLLSHTVLHPPALPASYSSPSCVSVSLVFFSLSFAALSYVALPLLSSRCSLFLSSYSLGLCTTVRSCWHSGAADGPLWASRQLGDFQWVPWGSLRKPEKNCPSMRRGNGTNCTTGWFGPLIKSRNFVKYLVHQPPKSINIKSL